MSRTSSDQTRYLSVSELVQNFNQTLESEYPQVCFEGEIFQLQRAASGHVYFSLKDEKSQVQAVMWRGMAAGLKFSPAPGMSVFCEGRPNVYHATGKLQVVINRMQQAGEGALQKRFLELKASLEKEGLFAEERKRPLPFLPRAVGVVTSGTGAVIHDIMVKFRERMPCLKIYLADVRVQGEGAADEIAGAIKEFNRQRLVDVIIVARGGGSLEDLWAFNEEVTVRSIFASKIPVVSGVGHEVDVTLSDLAADVRAPTPTAAAEMVVPRKDELLLRIGELERRLQDYQRWFEPLMQRLDEAVLRLEKRVAALREQCRLKVLTAEARLTAIKPDKIISLLTLKVDGLSGRLITGSAGLLRSCRFTFEKAASRLSAVGPLQVLERGYAVVQSRGKIVRSAAQLEVGESFGVTLWKGKITGQVSAKEEPK